MNQRELVERENQLLLLAAAWADDQDRQPDDPFLISRRAVHGHHGGFDLAVDAVLEFGALLGVGYVSAYAMIGDALQLRDRLPRSWDRVRAASVRAWQARKVAQATTDLDAEAAADLDDALAGYLGQLPWPRFARLLQTTVLQADPERLREREERARTERMVKAVDSDDGLKLLIARAASGDVIWFMATVNRMAEILQAEGDTDSVDVRRSKAIGILAAPARALDLLRRHAADHGGASLPHDAAGTPEAQHVSLRSDLDPGIRLDPVAARPRAVVVFHLSESTFSRCTCPARGGRAVESSPAARVLRRHRLSRHGPTGDHARRHRPGGRLRDPDPGSRSGPVAPHRRRLPVRQQQCPPCSRSSALCSGSSALCSRQLDLAPGARGAKTGAREQR